MVPASRLAGLVFSLPRNWNWPAFDPNMSRNELLFPIPYSAFNL